MDQLILKGIRRIIQLFFCGFFKLYCPMRIINSSRLPQNKSYILCANQSSHLDVFALIYATGRSVNDCLVLVAKDHLTGSLANRVKKFFLPFLISYFPVERRSGYKTDWRNFSKELSCYISIKTQKILIMFPDGTRSKNGELNSFHPGVSLLAHQLSIPVVPTYLSGMYHCLPHQTIIPKRTNIKVIFGEIKTFPESEINKFGAHLQVYNLFSESLFKNVKLLKQSQL